MIPQTSNFIEKMPYLFSDNISLIEDHKRNDKFLGRFVEYKDVVYCGDIFVNAKAIFEFGTINSGFYDKVIKIED